VGTTQQRIRIGLAALLGAATMVLLTTATVADGQGAPRRVHPGTPAPAIVP